MFWEECFGRNLLRGFFGRIFLGGGYLNIKGIEFFVKILGKGRRKFSILRNARGKLNALNNFMNLLNTYFQKFKIFKQISYFARNSIPWTKVLKMMIKIIHAYCGLVALKVLKVTVLIGYRFPFAENHQDHINKHFAVCTVQRISGWEQEGARC